MAPCICGNMRLFALHLCLLGKWPIRMDKTVSSSRIDLSTNTLLEPFSTTTVFRSNCTGRNLTLISDAAQVPCDLESLTFPVLTSHSLAMYDVWQISSIATNLEGFTYSIQLSTWSVWHLLGFFKFLLPCYFLQEQPAQTWIQRLTMGCREALCKMVLEKEEVIMENGSLFRV